jgi:hypothetical protein
MRRRAVSTSFLAAASSKASLMDAVGSVDVDARTLMDAAAVDVGGAVEDVDVPVAVQPTSVRRPALTNSTTLRTSALDHIS